MKAITSSLVLCAALTVSGAAQAALESRLGGQAVYDTDLKITWMADANLAATNTFGMTSVPSYMTWYDANRWIGAMNAAKYLGFDDWRLPQVQPGGSGCERSGFSGEGYNCTGSEFGHLFYNELGGIAGQYIGAVHNTNLGLFKNIQFHYWSGTEYEPGSSHAFEFSFFDGYWMPSNKGTNFHLWAVRTGDVAAVPVPTAAWLMGSGLLGLIGVARRKTA